MARRLTLGAALVSLVIGDGSSAADEAKCGELALQWVRERRAAEDAAAELQKTQSELDHAIFLHVPRTAGRVVHRCVLKRGYSDRCPKSYDALRVNFSNPQAASCGLFVSHQDYRLVEQTYSWGQPWTLLMIRNPVDRVLSSYEFAVEVSARQIGRALVCDYKKVCTRHVWPWTHLVPHFDDIMNTSTRLRVLHHRQGKDPEDQQTCDASNSAAGCSLNSEADDELDAARNPYACSMMQSLSEFLENETVRDVVDNSAGFQLLGISELTPVLNQGSDSGGMPGADEELDVSTSAAVASELRRCTREYGPGSVAGAALLEYALRRLEHSVDALLLHERLDDSISMAVTLLKQRRPQAQRILGADFQRCVKQQTEKMSKRKTRGMNNLVWPDGSTVWFGREARQNVPDNVIERIRNMNWLDLRLFNRATELFSDRFQELQDSGSLRRVKHSVVKNM
eukprot:TRINITY_DN38755_c0_g1_i1.p1 TRINITY_DN38755_c0_g1~~TRINITY_DN38755_c0_g1_i1.p1  ORF type:complete len:489 (+),score=89.81 TRINITY_DN38755_c0_g1_i1:107-1468(+)